jgi:hypothetical protein
MADTGLLVAHFDADLQKAYILAPDAPPFQKPVIGETFFPFFLNNGAIGWRRIFVRDTPDTEFMGYLDWLAAQSSAKTEEISILSTQEETVKEVVQAATIDQKDGFTLIDKRALPSSLNDWLKGVGA